MNTPVQPVLSVVIAIASDTTRPTNTLHLRPCLAALMQQLDPPPMEIIVPLPPRVAGLDALCKDFPEVRFLEVSDLRKHNGRGDSREHHGELISRGFALVRGSIVALIEDHDIVTPQWSVGLHKAHSQPFAGIGGAIDNGVDRPLNWAVYCCDFLIYQSPLPQGESTRASDANVSYKRAALEKIRPVWEEEFHEASVNGALANHGEKLTLASSVLVLQQRQELHLGGVLRERFVWGRSFGAWRCQNAPMARRMFWILFSPALPPLLMARMTLLAIRKRRTVGSFFKVWPLTSALVVSWVCGELTGYVTGRATSRGFQTAPLISRPTRTGS